MEATHSSAAEVVRLGTIREMLRVPGPCISIILPPYRPGEAVSTSAALLGVYVQEAARQLAERAFPTSATASLVRPLQRLAEKPALLGGSRSGRAIFRSPAVFQQFDLTLPAQATLSVGGCFAIRQLPQNSRFHTHSTYSLLRKLE